MHMGDNLIKGQTVRDDSHVQQKSQGEVLKKNVYKITIKTVLNI